MTLPARAGRTLVRRTLVRSVRGPAVALALAVVVAGGLVGCTETPQVRAGDPTVGGSAGTVDPGRAAASSPALAEQKKAAGLPDCPPSDATVAPVAKGLPDLTLACLGGGRGVRLAGLRGTAMVINLWGQWCGPCRVEAPYLAEVSRQLDDRVLMLGVDYADPRPELALDFAREAGWTYPQLFDQDKLITDAMRLPASPPQTIFVGADGVITFVHAGEFRSADELRSAITTHLGVTV